jgi:hypothetical protein
LHSNRVSSNTKKDSSKPCNIPWSELPHSQQMAYVSILDCFKNLKDRNKK